MEDSEEQIERLALRLSNLQAGFNRQEEEYYQSEKVRIYDLTKQVVKSPEAKEYWQQGMYTEVEVLNLFKQFRNDFSIHRNVQIMDFEFNEWFNQNKK